MLQVIMGDENRTGDNLEFIRNWRAKNPRLVVHQSSMEMDLPHKIFSKSVAATLRPHLEDLGISIGTMLEAKVWNDIFHRLPKTHDNLYWVGLLHLRDEASAIPHHFYDDMLILEAMCRYEIAVMNAWPILRLRFENYQPTSKRALAALLASSRGSAFPLGYEAVPPINELSCKASYSLDGLTRTADQARRAAELRRHRPDLEPQLRLHPKYVWAHHLYHENTPPLADALTMKLTAFLESRGLLPPPGSGVTTLQTFFDGILPPDPDSFLRAAIIHAPEVLPLGKIGEIISDYFSRLAPFAPVIENFWTGLSRPIRSLADIPNITKS